MCTPIIKRKTLLYIVPKYEVPFSLRIGEEKKIRPIKNIQN